MHFFAQKIDMSRFNCIKLKMRDFKVEGVGASSLDLTALNGCVQIPQVKYMNKKTFTVRLGLERP